MSVLRVMAWMLVLGAWVAPASAAAKGKNARLDISGTTDGARVFLDGKEVGTTPLTGYRLRSGTHKLVVRKLGYLEFKQRLVVHPGRKNQVMVDLLPFAGVLRVATDQPTATVHVDGKAVGKASASKPLELEVEPGDHAVAIVASGFPKQEESFAAQPGELHEIQASFASGGMDELALVPLAPPGGGEGSEEDLALLPLPPAKEVAAVDPAAAAVQSGPTGVEATAEPGQWYEKWWVWTIAGAVVAAAGVTTAVLLSQREPDYACAPEFDQCWPFEQGAIAGGTLAK